MAYTGYVNKKVQAMYGIPLSQLTSKERAILRADGKRRKKLIDNVQRDFMYNNKRAYSDEAQYERVLAGLYRECQKKILADVLETRAKVEDAGGEWSYANQSALTRSKGLFEQINKEIVKLGGAEATQLRDYLTDIYTDQFYRTIYTLGQVTMLKGSFNMLNPRLVEDTLNYPWSGAMFSDRIWLDKERLGKNLRWGLTQSMILGEGIPEMTKRINNGINTAKYNAERIARTETKRVTYSSQAQAFAEQGVKQVKYMTAGNGTGANICDVCKDYHGKVFDLGKEPTLPIHPNCRCWYVPVIPDTFEDNELNELTGSVRGAENYENWRKAHEAEAKKPGNSATTGSTAIDPKIRELENKKILAQSQIDVKNEEMKNVSLKYKDQIDTIEEKTVELEDVIRLKQQEIDDFITQQDNITMRKRANRLAHEDGKLSDDEYDAKLDKLIEERQVVNAAKEKAESEYYALWEQKNKYREELTEIHKKIYKERQALTDDIRELQRQITEIDNEITAHIKYPNRSGSFVAVMKDIENYQVEARAVQKLPKELTDEEIIRRLAGGDMTQGSCSSLAFAYMGNKCGFDVIDFRDGQSRKCFSRNSVIEKMANLKGAKTIIRKVDREVKDTAKILETELEKDKQYYLAVGRHAAMVRKTDTGLEYLELQSSQRNGWKSFDTYGSTQDTLYRRFGARKTIDQMKIGGTKTVFQKTVILIDADSFKGNEEYRELMSYINTDPKKQKKGATGDIR